MPKLHSSYEIVKALQRKGFLYISQRGSHVKFRRKTGQRTLIVIVPAGRKEIPMGTFKSILRQSGLREDDFE